MTFDVAAEAYQRFMGRYADLLARELITELRPHPPERALDVGAGTGALTAPLAAELGAGSVAAIDPSPAFVEALRRRVPGVDVREGAAEDLPFPDASFDLVLAQLVIHFMTEPVRGVAEMARVAVSGGTVAASTWDFAGGRAPLSLFWNVARELDPAVRDESDEPGVREGEVERIFREAGLDDVRGGEITVRLPYLDPHDWWQPYTLGVGPGVIEATAWLAVATR